MKRILVLITMMIFYVILYAKLDIIAETSDYLLIEFNLGDYSFIELDEYIYLNSPGIDFSDDAGAPMLPYLTTYIGIPENGVINLQIMNQERVEHRLSKPLMPIPEVIQGEQVSEYVYSIDEAKYRHRSEQILNQGEPTYFRYNAVIPVTINPFSYNYEQGRLTVSEKITIGIRITGNTSQRNNQIDDIDLSFNILNYDTARYWQVREQIDINHAPFYQSEFWYSFEISENGMYELTYQQLSALPLDIIDPRNIRIFSTGGKLLPNLLSNSGYPFEEIPLLIIGEDNGQFDQGDRIIFYAHKRDGFAQNEYLSSTVNHYFNPYSGRTVYWLTFGGDFSEPPKRMPLQNHGQASITRTSSPQFFHYESESVRRDQRGFTWFTSLLTGVTDTNHNYSFNLNNVDTSKEQKFIIAVQAGDSSTHSLSMNINGNTIINRQSWVGSGYRTFQRDSNFLQNGTNNAVLTIHRTGSSSIYFDYFTVYYHRLLSKGNSQLLFSINEEDFNQTVQYNLTGSNIQNLRAFEIVDFHQVSQLEVDSPQPGTGYDFSITGLGGQDTQYAVVRDGEYLTVGNFQEDFPVDLTIQNFPVEAIIITPEIFRGYADQLALKYQNERGIATKIVDQQEIFNQFNSGMPDPNAIRLFIRHAFYNYPIIEGTTSLKYITLIGSGSVDWRNFSGLAAEKNKLILFHKGVETSEDFFVDQSGNNLPDIGIGRITVENINQSDIVFDKIFNYWINPTPGLWKNTPLFFADDEYKGTNNEEIGHSLDIQEISQLMSPSVIVDKIFGFNYPFDPFGNKPLAREEMISTINEGRLIWLYIGHGAPHMLGDESYFRMIDIQLLKNRDHLPLFISASCSVGKYDYFGLSSLSENLLWHPNGGSIASLAANFDTSPGPNRRLMRNFMVSIINNYESPGIALMQAKNSLSESQHRYYTYMGDPVLPIVTPQRTQNISIYNNPDSLFAYQLVELSGSFSESGTDSIIDIIAYSSEQDLKYTGQADQLDFDYTQWGSIYYRGQSNLNNGSYDSSFMIPGDILPGNRGRIVSYYFNPGTKKDFVDYYYPKRLTNIPYANAVPDTLPPEVTIWLDTPNFRNGDIVSPNPILYARIHDDSGINILGELGHKILILFDNQSSPIDATSGFIYDVGSYQTGTLTWQLLNLAEGEHNLQLIVFDNYNNPAVTRVNFIVRVTESIVIEKLLPYPNPMSSDGYFTFLLNENAQITITIYTITGRRIRTLTAQGVKGYNQIYWDGRDQENSRLANNTYLYRIRARDLVTNKVTEQLGKVIILR
ncbi:MAG: type IX secretion system sortase PorU [Candidatus Cloacimonetes bacterium]|nr:type IX secretion system sortase PorU [Candidatus Cloacimonadota bacterium]